MNKNTKNIEETDEWTLPAGQEVAIFQRDDRIMGTLVGCAIGDAIGAPFEFATPPKRGHATYGKATFGFSYAEFTDDTQQAIQVCKARSDVTKTAEGLLAWYQSGPRDIGGQTHAILGRCTTAADLPYFSRAYGLWLAERPTPKGFDPGLANGSLMRTCAVPLPLIGHREVIAQRAREISDLTHADPNGYTADACVIWSEGIEAAIRQGEAWQPADITAALEFIPEDRQQFWAETIKTALHGPKPGKQNGSAIGAFRCALYAVAHGRDAVDVIQLACSLGGDTDTVAAIAGSLAGAKWGGMAFPRELRKPVHGRDLDKVVGIKQLEVIALRAAGRESRTYGLADDAE